MPTIEFPGFSFRHDIYIQLRQIEYKDLDW